MVKISGWTYLLFGLFISISSFYINQKGETSRMTLFLIAGVVFIIIGIGKGITKLIKNSEEKKNWREKRDHPESLHHPPHYTQHQTQSSKNTNTPTHQNTQTQAKFCPSCGNIITHNGNYCIFCGEKLR